MKFFIRCTISTVRRCYSSVIMHNSSIGLKQDQTRDGRDCFKQVYSKVTESWCVEKMLCPKSRGYIEDLLETTADAQMTTSPHYCLPKIETILKYIRTVGKPKKVEAIKSMQIRFEVGKTKIN